MTFCNQVIRHVPNEFWTKKLVKCIKKLIQKGTIDMFYQSVFTVFYGIRGTRIMSSPGLLLSCYFINKLIILIFHTEIKSYKKVNFFGMLTIANIFLKIYGKVTFLKQILVSKIKKLYLLIKYHERKRPGEEMKYQKTTQP